MDGVVDVWGPKTNKERGKGTTGTYVFPVDLHMMKIRLISSLDIFFIPGRGWLHPIQARIIPSHRVW